MSQPLNLNAPLTTVPMVAIAWIAMSSTSLAADVGKVKRFDAPVPTPTVVQTDARVGVDFSVEAEFESADPNECRCVEYRQQVRGKFTEDGNKLSHKLTLDDPANPGSTIEVEMSETDFKPDSPDYGSGRVRYGHRGEAKSASENYTKGGTGPDASDENRSTGCKYTMTDGPGIANLRRGHTYVVDLEFSGTTLGVCEACDTCESKTWEANATHTTPPPPPPPPPPGGGGGGGCTIGNDGPGPGGFMMWTLIPLLAWRRRYAAVAVTGLLALSMTGCGGGTFGTGGGGSSPASTAFGPGNWTILNPIRTGFPGKEVSSVRAMPTLTVGDNGIMLDVQMAAPGSGPGAPTGSDLGMQITVGGVKGTQLEGPGDGPVLSIQGAAHPTWYFARGAGTVDSIDFTYKGSSVEWKASEGSAL